jgi:hypothetical protein
MGKRALTLFSPAGGGNLAGPQAGCWKFPLSLGGVGPPRTGGGSFHEANGRDEGVENARVLPGAGSIAQDLVKGKRLPANQVLRLFDPDRSQIAGDRCANVGDCFEDCGESRMGRLACGHLERRKAEGERRKGRKGLLEVVNFDQTHTGRAIISADDGGVSGRRQQLHESGLFIMTGPELRGFNLGLLRRSPVVVRGGSEGVRAKY